jgi:ATP-dependent Lhr-like helicase
MARADGSFVVLESGEVRLYLERGGRSLITCGAVAVPHLQALADSAARMGKLEIQTVDGAPVKGTPMETLLRETGFGTTPKGLVLWPERRPAVPA